MGSQRHFRRYFIPRFYQLFWLFPVNSTSGSGQRSITLSISYPLNFPLLFVPVHYLLYIFEGNIIVVNFNFILTPKWPKLSRTSYIYVSCKCVRILWSIVRFNYLALQVWRGMDERVASYTQTLLPTNLCSSSMKLIIKTRNNGPLRTAN